MTAILSGCATKAAAPGAVVAAPPVLPAAPLSAPAPVPDVAEAPLAAVILPANFPAFSTLPAGSVPVIRNEWRTAKVANQFGQAVASDSGLLLTTTKFTTNEYNLQIGWRTTQPLQRGQVILLRFAARSLKAAEMTGQTQLGVFFQKAAPPWDKTFHAYVQLDDQWRVYDLPFKVSQDYAAGGAGINLAFGFAPQTVEIAQLQVLAYPAGTELTALPRTQPPPGEPDPQLYDQTLTRIRDYRKLLSARLAGNPTPTPGRTLQVAAGAATAGDGSVASPFATIQAAVDVAQPGDTVLVAAGTYDQYDTKQTQVHTKITCKGRADAWIVIKAADPHARPKIVAPTWKAFALSGAEYVVIQGLEFEGVLSPVSKESGNGIAILDRSVHIRIIDNVVHGFGGGGIYAKQADYVQIEGNVVYHTSHGSVWGNSGISIYQSINADDAPGYHQVIRRNIAYDNENLKPFKNGNGQITDGNGIIMDDNRHTQAKTKEEPYRGWTLIENNLVYGNGGRGIHAFLSDRIDVINNTVYMNQHTKDIRNGEITAINADLMTFLNNLVVTRPDARANTDDRSTHIVVAHNLFFNTDDVLPGKDALVGKDPRLRKPAVDSTTAEDFRLLPGSPALGAGLAGIAPPDDLFGHPRTGAIELGAIQGVAR